MKRKTKPTYDRFIAKIKKVKSGCWEWQAFTNFGYGVFTIGHKLLGAHRYSYEYYNGKIPKGLVIDHLCRNRKCVNPDHLEAVTIQENTRRGLSVTTINSKKTHCKYGHPLKGDNLLIRPRKRADGSILNGRLCLTCKRTWSSKFINERRLLSDYLKKHNVNLEIPDPVEYKISRLCPDCGVDDVVIIPSFDGLSVTTKEHHKKDCKLLPVEWNHVAVEQGLLNKDK